MKKSLGIAIAMLATTLLSATPYAPETRFEAAQPVWLKDREKEMNLFAGFRTQIEAPASGKTELKLTGSTIYRASVNGKFAGYGPARGPHDFYRVDTWDITPLLTPGTNTIAIEIAGYNMNSFYLLNQPSFLQAEVLNNGKVLAATSAAPDQAATFEGFELPWRRQKIQRICFMRPSAEAYDMQTQDAQWFTGKESRAVVSPLVQTEPKTLIDRGVTYPRFHQLQPIRHHAKGKLKSLDQPVRQWRDRSLNEIGPTLNGFQPEELEMIITDELLKHPDESGTTISETYAPKSAQHLATLAFHEYDFGRILTGFPSVTVQVNEPTRLVMSFDETLTNNFVYPLRQAMVNAVIYDLAPGSYDLELFEPMTLQYLRLATYSGSAEVSNIALREYACDDVWTAQFRSDDNRLNTLFEAGRETFRQNSLDTFMDCPSRERAGYLCDSFFTARAAADLCPTLKLEQVFFENYMLPTSFKHIPDGMLPMCYPSDHDANIHIPNYAMWFVVQLEEYLERSGDKAMINALKPRVEKVFTYLEQFENSDSLLEKVPGWIFIEWSAAERFVQDVSYPTNMLYARALDSAGDLYSNQTYKDKAKTIRKAILEQSFDGEFFIDNALRTDTGLKVTTNSTEVCQYFAFFFETATPESHPELWQRLLHDFGPHRKETKKWASVHYANAFVGNVMRMELLSRAGLSDQVVEEAIGYYLYQADHSGTFWEMEGPTNSMNHGFAANVCHLLNRDVLGVSEVNHARRTVTVHIPDTHVRFCEGRIPAPTGFTSLRWTREGNTVTYNCEIPAGYTLTISAAPGLTLQQR